jgi:hypothetical protein
MLDTGKESIPVRIRNLSSRGALIEAAGLPPVGADVRLVRGHLIANGELAWLGEGQGGVTFEGSIEVNSWVQRVAHSGQERVDRTIAAIRHSMPVTHELQSPESESLVVMSASLDRVCERLAEAPNMSMEFAEELLKLDAIAQSLRRLATGRNF